MLDQLRREVETAVRDATGDFPEVNPDDIFHDAAHNICTDWYLSQDPEKEQAVKEFWRRNFGQAFEDTLYS